MLNRSPPIPMFIGQPAFAVATSFLSFVTFAFSQLVIAMRESRIVNMNVMRFIVVYENGGQTMVSPTPIILF